MSWRPIWLLGALVLSGCPSDPPPMETCDPTPTRVVGQPCGPCALDTLECSDGVWSCSGATSCGYGNTCESDADCEQGACTAGRCAPGGMSWIPAGSFEMGSRALELGHAPGELLHPVRLTRHYFMDSREVSQAEFEELMLFNPSNFTSCGPDCPVENVTWVEALAYANARSVAEGLPPCYDLTHCRREPGNNYRCPLPASGGQLPTFDLDCVGYRLPTEAEWEYAYRAGTSTAFYSGDVETESLCEQALLEGIAQFCGNCTSTYGQEFDCSMGGLRPSQPTDCGTTTVASYAPNDWGLFDMSGNVEEMVWDALGPYEAFAENPAGPEHYGTSVQRGAGFCGHMARLRAADRKFNDWTTPSPTRGLRLVRTHRFAPAEERLNEELCNNGCGGCTVLAPAPGTPCGRCGDGIQECLSETETQCVGASESCNYGELCEDDDDCSAGTCSNGHCAQDGFVYVPAGYFAMGSPPTERGRRDDETQHDVVLERPFLLGRHEVTREEWSRLFGTSPSQFSGCGDDCPVTSVNRDDALAYANALSDAQGLEQCYDLSECEGRPGDGFSCPQGITFDLECEGFRLPTEAEWEYAYRAESTSAYYNGSVRTGALCEQPLLEEIAQFCGNCAREYGTVDCGVSGSFPNCGPGPVGELAPNALGLFDMGGNAQEIVWDLYGPYPGFAVNPTGPADEGELQQVARGGGFCGHMARLRAADRKAITRTARLQDLGFRIARTMPSDGSGPVCDNACGGCRELVPDVGEPCGPCLADRFECDGTEATVCPNRVTSCTFGGTCSTDGDCTNAVCRSGFCTAPGFAYIPPGSFTMGSPPSEPGRDADETPHTVTLTRGFLMMETEVSQGLFQSLLGANPSGFASCGLDCPVESVTWLEALAFANALSADQGLTECYDLSSCTGEAGGRLRCDFDIAFSLDCDGYRLPTEAEWEYAYRAGTTTTFYVGDEASALNCDQPILDGHAQFCGNCSVSYPGSNDCSATGGFADCGTTDTGSRMANAWGLRDMIGNVSELVWDVIAPYPSSSTDPVGPAHGGQNNVHRGGGYCSTFPRLRAADRSEITRIARNPSVGFRLVRTVSP